MDGSTYRLRLCPKHLEEMRRDLGPL